MKVSTNNLVFLSFKSGSKDDRDWLYVNLMDDDGNIIKVYSDSRFINDIKSFVSSLPSGEPVVVVFDLYPSYDGKSFRAMLNNISYSE